MTGFSRRRAAFTLIELLVAVIIVALLIALVTGVASRAIYQQKKSITDQTMAALTRAVEQFATANPLRALYERKDLETFAAYPPYQLRLPGGGAQKEICAPYVMESDPPAPRAINNGVSTLNLLSERLARDFGCKDSNVADWVQLAVDGGTGETLGHDDIRALMAYMLAFDNRALDQVSPSVFRPLRRDAGKDAVTDTTKRDYVNPKGPPSPGPTNAGSSFVDVLVPHDGWGVPLDYMLYAKYEWKSFRDQTGLFGTPGLNVQGFRVVDRKPAFRSRGVSREEYDAWIASNKTDAEMRALALKKPGSWLFSEALPKPWAQITDQDDASHQRRDGLLKDGFKSAANGWLRVVARNEDYHYRPDLDVE